MKRSAAEHVTGLLAELGASPADYALAAGVDPGLVRCIGLRGAAVYTGLGERTLRRLYDGGELPACRIGKRVVFDRLDLDHLIDQSKEA